MKPDYAKALRTASLDALKAAHEEKILGRSRLREEIELILRDKLTVLEIKESTAANEAIANGASKTAVGRAMGTSDWGTIEAVLARTAGDMPTEARVIDPLDSIFSFDLEANTLTVTIDGEDLDAMIDAWGDWDAWGAKHAGANTATFEVRTAHDGRATFRLTQPNMIDLKWNLAGKWLDVPANEAQARAYVEGRGWGGMIDGRTAECNNAKHNECDAFTCGCDCHADLDY